MRVTTLLRRLLGVTQIYVERVQLRTTGMLSVSVRPSWRRSRCGVCGRRAPRYDRQPARLWRHVPWGRTTVWLRYAPWRVSCGRCGVRVEQVSWAVHGSAFTAPLEEAGGVSVAGDGPHDGESSGGDLLAGARQHRRAGGGSPSGVDAAGGAAAHRRRRVQLSEAATTI